VTIESSEKQPDYQCSKCQKTIRTQIGVLRHKELYCKQCEECSPERVSFDIHMGVNHDRDIPFKCSNCGKELAEELDINNHRCDPTPLKIMCKKCSFTCNASVEMEQHLVSEHEAQSIPRTISCEKCSFTCNVRVELQFHLETQHEVEEIRQNFTCSDCTFIGFNQEQLELHTVSSHTFPCMICKDVFKSRDRLNQHSITHEPSVRIEIMPNVVKPISCERCEYRCKFNIQLKKHVATKHAADYKFECNFCEFKSNVLMKMYEHKFVNHPENPMDFTPSASNVNELVLTTLAEQNYGIMEEITNIKDSLKDAFDMLARDIQNCFDHSREESTKKIETITTTLVKISQKVDTLVEVSPPKHSKTHEKPRQEASDHSPQGLPPQPEAPQPEAPQPEAPPRTSQRNRGQLRRKSSQYLRKPKVLLIGDSIAHNANFNAVEMETNVRVKTVKAYSSTHNPKARWPKKNVADVTPSALSKTYKDDQFTHLVVAAPTVDISNLDTSKLSPTDNMEYFKQEVAISCRNIFAVAHDALKNKPDLEKVIIMEHAQRFDEPFVDPLSLKPALAKYANVMFHNLWMESPMKSKIIVAAHSLQYNNDTFEARYKDDKTGKFDGVHMYGSAGKTAYTRSLINIFNQAVASKSNGSSKSNDSHTTCPQTRYSQQKYSVPVHNMFDILGN
jgi:hypothetical protein